MKNSTSKYYCKPRHEQSLRQEARPKGCDLQRVLIFAFSQLWAQSRLGQAGLRTSKVACRIKSAFFMRAKALVLKSLLMLNLMEIVTEMILHSQLVWLRKNQARVAAL